MQRCSGCGEDIPDNASFCGYCGHFKSVATEIPTSMSQFPNTILPTNAPTAIPGPITTDKTNIEQVYLDAVNRYKQVEQGMNEDQQQRDGLLGQSTSYEQADAGGDTVPMVQETPQVGEGPMVQETPMPQTSFPFAPNTPIPGSTWELTIPSTQNSSNNAPPSTWTPSVPNVPNNAPGPVWSREAWDIPVPLSSQQPPSVPNVPNNAPGPVWSRELENMSAPPPPFQQQVPHQQRRRRGYFQQPFKKAIIISMTSVLVATVIVILILLIPSTLSVATDSGGKGIIAGESLHIYGDRFFPLTSITLTLDQGVPLSPIGARASSEAVYSARPAPALASQMISNLQPDLLDSSSRTVAVGIDGTFEATVALNEQLPSGSHTIHAKESLTGRVTDLSFQLLPKSTSLVVVQQTQLVAGSSDCPAVPGSGNLIRGWSCTVTVSGTSGTINWSVSSSDATHTTFTPSTGVVSLGNPERVTIFIANQLRCSNATFAFVGPANTVPVSWTCPAH